jgi:hypothetical protein
MAKNGRQKLGKEMAGKVADVSPVKNTGKKAGKGMEAKGGGSDVSDAVLEDWARDDAAAMAQLMALIPQVHLRPQEQGREIAKKYMKKVKDTVSDKVARATADKRAKKRAKFDGEPAQSKGGSDR